MGLIVQAQSQSTGQSAGPLTTMHLWFLYYLFLFSLLGAFGSSLKWINWRWLFARPRWLLLFPLLLAPGIWLAGIPIPSPEPFASDILAVHVLWFVLPDGLAALRTRIIVAAVDALCLADRRGKLAGLLCLLCMDARFGFGANQSLSALAANMAVRMSLPVDRFAFHIIDSGFATGWQAVSEYRTSLFEICCRFFVLDLPDSSADRHFSSIAIDSRADQRLAQAFDRDVLDMSFLHCHVSRLRPLHPTWLAPQRQKRVSLGKSRLCRSETVRAAVFLPPGWKYVTIYVSCLY